MARGRRDHPRDDCRPPRAGRAASRRGNDHARPAGRADRGTVTVHRQTRPAQPVVRSAGVRPVHGRRDRVRARAALRLPASRCRVAVVLVAAARGRPVDRRRRRRHQAQGRTVRRHLPRHVAGLRPGHSRGGRAAHPAPVPADRPALGRRRATPARAAGQAGRTRLARLLRRCAGTSRWSGRRRARPR